MTLTEVLPAIRKLSSTEKLQLIRILAEELETSQDISPLEPFKTSDLPTPYNSFGAGEISRQTIAEPLPSNSLLSVLAQLPDIPDEEFPDVEAGLLPLDDIVL